MSEKIRVLLDEETVEKRICEVAAQISEEYKGKEIHMICVLKGGVFFMCELAKRITVPVTLDFMSVSSYGDDTKSSGVVKIVKDLDQPLEDKEVLVVEDIIDSGRTLSYLLDVLKRRNPNSVRLCTLLDKPDRNKLIWNIEAAIIHINPFYHSAVRFVQQGAKSHAVWITSLQNVQQIA